MRVLVTGSTGLIGSAVVRRLKGDGHEVIAASSVGIEGSTAHGDLRVPGIAARLLEISQPQVVVHCAARIGGIALQKADPSAAVLSNLVMSAHVIDACAKAKPQPRLVFLSSSTVYPMVGPATFRDGNTATEDWPLKPEPLYQGVGGVKAYLEQLLSFYGTAFDLRFCSVRPTAVIGESDKSDHVVPDLIRRALTGALPLTVWGASSTVRDFVYVDDVARGILAVIEQGKFEVGPFNLGSGTSTTIGKIADAIMLTVHGPHRLVELEDRSSAPLIVFDETKPQAIPIRQVSIEKAKTLLGWTPQVSPTEAISRIVKSAQQTAQGGSA